MTCNDCIHYEVCKVHGMKVDDTNFRKEFCGCFKDKSRFVELPCKVGDQAYYIKHASVFDHTIDEVKYEFTATENGNIVRGIYFEPKHIGKTVFLTREEAEKKLGEMKL